jgi:MFS family permease
MSSQFGLLKARRFAPFFATQFLGAFNDNLFKNALVVLLTFQAASWTTLTPEVLTNLAAGIFILPFFLFSATAGQLADKYDKAKLARLVKLLEIVIMGVALLGFSMHSLEVLLAGAVPAWPAFDPVRAGQVRDPAAASARETNSSAATRWSRPGLSSPS